MKQSEPGERRTRKRRISYQKDCNFLHGSQKGKALHSQKDYSNQYVFESTNGECGSKINYEPIL